MDALIKADKDFDMTKPKDRRQKTDDRKKKTEDTRQMTENRPPVENRRIGIR
jgi:hypothetical protein